MAGGVNPYIYCFNDPIDWVDLYGLDPAVRWTSNKYNKTIIDRTGRYTANYRKIELFDANGNRNTWDIPANHPWYDRDSFSGFEVRAFQPGDVTHNLFNWIYHQYADYDLNESCEVAGDYLRSDSVNEKFDTFSALGQASPTQFVGIDYVIQNWEGGSESTARILKTYGGAINSAIKRK